MLSGTLRAVLTSWVTIRNVASICAFRSMISWLRNEVRTQREGDVVVEVHRAEHGAVLEQHAEQLADLVELLLGARGDVDALDHDAALVGLEQPDDGLEKDRLAGAGGAEHDADLAC